MGDSSFFFISFSFWLELKSGEFELDLGSIQMANSQLYMHDKKEKKRKKSSPDSFKLLHV